jgi:peptidoglycan/xylan/chitin deacetylase (PgdA/CDA1 family)
MTRCLEDLNAIPEVAASLQARTKKSGDEGSLNGPLSGMEIALTLDLMVRSTADPDRDLDDWCYTENSRENFEKLIAALKQNSLPPTVDFLSGDSLDQPVQEEWLRSGNLIGTMTYAGLSVKKRSAVEFISALEKNELALAPLWIKFQRKQKYFRYPALKLGLDEQRQREVRDYLKQNGYVVVPATINSRADYFSQPYCAALARGDVVCANFISATFKSLLLDKTTKARAAARTIAGRDVKQIWSIGASQLTCDLLSELLNWYKAMGVRFISLDEALSDPFYATEDVTNTANQIIWETRRAQSGAE